MVVPGAPRRRWIKGKRKQIAQERRGEERREIDRGGFETRRRMTQRKLPIVAPLKSERGSCSIVPLGSQLSQPDEAL